MLGYLVVFLGGGIGAALRHGVNRASMVLFSANLPFGTFLVNVVGCFIMGLLAGWFAWRGELPSQTLRLFLTTGILGGFTTFSAFSLDAALLWERGQVGIACTYVLLSVGLSIVGMFAGLTLSRTLFS